MQNATTHYLDDDATASGYCHDCHEWNGEHMQGCPGDPNAAERIVPRVITKRDVLRTLGGMPGVEFVDGRGIFRSREEDK